MKSNEVKVAHYLKGSNQIWIPPYQRPYQWDLDRWTELWRDFSVQYERAKFPILDETVVAHFMGTLIVEAKEMLPGSSTPRIGVIDGQQRLITFFLLLAAIRDQHAFENNLKVPKKNSLSFITVEYGQDVDRVVMEREDTDVLKQILYGKFVESIPWSLKDSVLNAYIFFRRQAWIGEKSLTGVDPIEVPRVSRAVQRETPNVLDAWEKQDAKRTPLSPATTDIVFTQGFKVLEILLDASDEEASIIFETMNSRRTELLQFDQLRSSIWVALPTSREEFHNSDWQSAEKTLAQLKTSSSRNVAEQFFYEYLISTGVGRTTFKSLHRDFMQNAYQMLGYPIRDEERFKDELLRPMANNAQLYKIALAQDIHAKTSIRDLSIGSDLQEGLKELNALAGTPLHPIVLIVLDSLWSNIITEKDAVKAIDLLQSYVVRTMLAGKPLSPMRSTTMRMSESLRESKFSVSKLKQVLTKNDWYTDVQVLRAVTTTPLYEYGASNIFPILRGIERQLVKRG